MRTAVLQTSERKRLTELANRQGLNRIIRELIDAHPDEHTVLLCGNVDRFKMCNDRFTLTVKEAFGDLSEADRASFDEALAHAAGERGMGECEMCVRRRDEEFWVHASIRPLSEEDTVYSLLVVLDEITEVQALRNRLSAAMESVPDGLSFYRIAADDSVELLDCNNRFAEMLGMTREAYKLQCKSEPLACVATEDRWSMHAAFDELLAGSSRAEATIRANHVDGTARWLLLSASLFYAGPEFTYVVVAFIDVTAGKVKELRYRELAEQQQQLYEAVPCGIVRHTLEDRPVIESANRVACRILGFENFAQLQVVLSDDVFGVMIGDGAAAVKDAMARLREGSPPVPFKIPISTTGGETGWIEGFISLTTTADGRTIVQSAFNDVTEERREDHRRELQRFTSVLCSVYDEIFEFDLACDTFTLWFSTHASVEDMQPTSISAALDRWFAHLPREEDRLKLMTVLDAYRLGTADEITKLECLFGVGDRTVWFETAFLRVSDTTVLCCNYDITARKAAEDEQLFQHVGDVVSNLPAGIGVYDMDKTGIYARYVSDAVCAMLGVNRADYQRAIAARRSSAPAGKVREFLAAHPQEWFDFSTENKLKRRGEPFTARVQGRAVRLDDDAVRAYVVITDVTEEVRERQERAWQNERYRILSELTHAISFDYDSGLDEVLLYIDRTGEGMEAQVIPSYLETLEDTRRGVVHPDSLETVRTMFERAREGTKNEIIEYRADYYGTGYQWYRTNLFVTHDEGGVWHLVGLIENIQMERELRVKAEHDAITGLSNYASTRDMVNDALTDPHVRVHSVCAVIDLDDFKSVNDRCGHLRGDELLQQVGSVLRANCRESDVVGRVGGDEFVVFLKNIGIEVAVRKLAAMKHAVSELGLPPECEPGTPLPSISIGATATCSGDTGYRDVFSRADKALYQAKGQGKNRLRVK